MVNDKRVVRGATLEELKENMADAVKMVLDYKKEETRSHYLGKKTSGFAFPCYKVAWVANSIFDYTLFTTTMR